MIGIDLLALFATAGLFCWLKKSNGSLTSCVNTDLLENHVSISNSAFLFVKPHANTPETQKLVRDKLSDAGISILSEISIDGPTIDRKKLIDQHYYAIASKATILSPKNIPVPPEKFEESFGESWSTVLSQGRAVNAMEACERFQCDPESLNSAWAKSEKVVKLGGGFYCGIVSMNGLELYVFNAFFMNMRQSFVADESSIHCFEIQWDPDKLSWADFRGRFLGPTDPAEAPEGSLRRLIFKKWKGLGLQSAPNKGENGVHASASPFEGLAEKMNWLSRPIDKDPFGKALLKSGISKKTIRAWSLDPRVRVSEDGQEGSIFDALEDMDASQCLDRIVELKKLN